MKEFIEICKKSQKQLRKYCRKELLKCGYNIKSEEKYVYAPGEIPVLLVAHMDTVHKENCTDVCVSDTGFVMSPQGIGGDDRCGVYMILQIVRDLKCHVLFTEDEEIGGIGAKKFSESQYVKDMNVNYIIEFDRRGFNDAVYYYCSNDDFEEFVSEFGWVTNFGSYSDIVDVAPKVGVAAVNLSSGYFNAHTTSEYVDFYAVKDNIRRAKEMIETETEKFEYVEAFRRYYGGRFGSRYNWGGYYGDYYEDDYNWGMTKYEEIEDDVDTDWKIKNVDICLVNHTDVVSPSGVNGFDTSCYGVDKDLKVYRVDFEDGVAYESCIFEAKDYVKYDDLSEFTVTAYYLEEPA